MQKNIKFLILTIQNFFVSKNFGIFLDKDLSLKIFKNLKSQELKNINLEKFSRLYVAVSHGLLDFEVVKVPKGLPLAKKFSAARLEALRLFELFHGVSSAEKIYLAYYPLSEEEILVSRIEEGLLRKCFSKFPRGVLIGGVFPAWAALYAYLRAYRHNFEENALFYVRSSGGYEGFWLKEGSIAGILPYSSETAEKFLSHYQGPVKELGSSEVLAEGAIFFPRFFEPAQAPTFENYPLLVRPHISPKVIPLWLLPILIFGGAKFVNYQQASLEISLQKVNQVLKEAQKKYEAIEVAKKKRQEKKRLEKALYAYLPEKRPSLLRYLLEITVSFPEEAWIRRFEFRGPEEIRIWGEAENALVVLDSLAQNGIFRDVRFLSTVTKNPVSKREAFSIQLKVAVSKEKDKGPDGGGRVGGKG